MTINEIKKTLNSKEYDFLRTNEHLGKNIILLGLGGSHAYGTNIETSDLDVRGIAINTADEILSGNCFEQVVNNETDTTIYSLNKIVRLLSNVNPNTIEILGLKPEHYLILSDCGKDLLNNSHMFLSKVCIHSFGGYANAQLRKLENLTNREIGAEQREKYIKESIDHAMYDLKTRYSDNGKGIKVYVDKNEENEFDLFIDAELKHYPLRDYTGLWSELKSIVSNYDKLPKRDRYAIEHNKISKHMEHCIRLYFMCLDILLKEEIITYRSEEHDLLMDIRNGNYLDSDNKPIKAFYSLVDDMEKKLSEAKEKTHLPDKPDYKKINEFLIKWNKRIIEESK